MFLNCTTLIHAFYVAAYSNTSVIHKVVAETLLIRALQEGMSSEIWELVSHTSLPKIKQINNNCLWMLLFFSVVTTVPLFIMATLELLMIRRSLMEICGELIRWIFCLDFLALPSMSKFVFCYAVEWNDWGSGFTDSGLSRSPFSWVFGIVHGWGEKWLGRKGNDFNTD